MFGMNSYMGYTVDFTDDTYNLYASTQPEITPTTCHPENKLARQTCLHWSVSLVSSVTWIWKVFKRQSITFFIAERRIYYEYSFNRGSRWCVRVHGMHSITTWVHDVCIILPVCLWSLGDIYISLKRFWSLCCYRRLCCGDELLLWWHDDIIYVTTPNIMWRPYVCGEAETRQNTVFSTCIPVTIVWTLKTTHYGQRWHADVW